MNSDERRIYGYFTDAAQTVPVFDPGLTVPCPICVEDLGVDAEKIRTISLLVPGDGRSYFYRVHISCHEPLSEQERINVDGLLIEAIYAKGNVN